jgi:hypothetical protein
MRNKWLLCLVGVLFILQFYVFLLPVYGATCTADCGGGTSVSCTGHRCEAVDGAGCQSWKADGTEATVGACAPPTPQ